MISVSYTFLETLLIIRRNFWLMIIISLIVGIPRIVCNRIITTGHTHSAALSVISLIGLLGMFFFDAVYIAAIIGLLRKPSSEESAFPIIWQNVQTHTWSLLRLSCLLVLIAFVAAIPFALLLAIVKPSNVIWAIVLGVIFVLLKYSLAYPLVVIDKMGAREALKRSWEMTRGHLGYALSCYFFLWLVTWPIENICGSNRYDLAQQSGGVFFLKKFVVYLIDSLWIILSWCMYLQIKARDALIPTSLEKPNH